MHLIKIYFFHKCAGLLKLFRCLPRESHDNIRRDRRMFIILTQQIAFFQIFFRCVSAIHSFQNSAASALQGQMEMWTYLRQFYQSLYKTFCDNPRLQRSQSDTFNTVNLMQCLNQFQQAAVAVNAIRTQMNSCQHQLLKTVFCQSAGFHSDILQFSASNSASRIRNDAVTAKLITAILHFQKCTSML